MGLYRKKYARTMEGFQMPGVGYCIHHKDFEGNVQSLLTFRQFSPCDIEKAPIIGGFDALTDLIHARWDQVSALIA